MRDNVCEKNETVVLPSLILIPDISGFTQYMSATSIEHSQVNIARLLESIIDSNNLDLSISEIEGDAILFNKFNDESTVNIIVAQIKKMYLSFHRTLKNINENNDCQCGACNILHNLSLKFVVHHGKVGSVMVKGYCKLFGSDIIVAHRLLKNQIPLQEYILFTDDFMKKYNAQPLLLNEDWIKLEENSDTYNILGNIKYHYSSLNELKEHHNESL